MSVHSKVARAAVVAAATAAVTVMTTAPAFAIGPTYKWQAGTRTVDRCVNHTSGGTAVGGWAHGQFVANSNGGGACSVTYLELIYVNTRGNEVAKYAVAGWGHGGDTCGASCDQIVLPRSAYRRIVEVIGSSTSGMTGRNTGGTYLYY